MTSFLIALGGLSGALGVTLSALGAHHPGGAQLAPAAQFLLAHGPVFLALAALARIKALPALGMGVGALLLALGLAFFAGDLSRRVFSGARLFPNAAPLGGALLIGGWVWLMLAGIISGFKQKKAD
jgi:uncharacterized membrane protein YgdD (TMEM256/DUF423 family)